MKSFLPIFDRDFSRAVEDVLSDGEVSLASPYLSTSLVEDARITRILTDVLAWCRSTTDRAEACEFLRRTQVPMRDLSGLHAKVLLGSSVVLVGSANFTRSGIGPGGNVEAGLLVSDPEVVARFRRDFERWWDVARRFDPKGLAREWEAAEIPPRPPSLRLRIPYDPPPTSTQPASREHSEESHPFVAALARFGGRDRAEAYLRLVGIVLEELGRSPDHPELLISIPKEKRRLFPVSIRNRYLLYGRANSPGGVIALREEDAGRFHLEKPPGSGWTFAVYGRLPPMSLYPLKDLARLLEDSGLNAAWRQAARDHLSARRGNPKRTFHRPLVGEAALDQSFASEMLTLSFPDSGDP